ncbi:hypothetical protein MPH_10382 [Macrophomina phaseolina MS6]|uniref:Uncharacterized protein n=1 Tax=Macrophomina phaseolina (strain MS6) TaxID=1126212 RepID=K2RI55_MACPH|nr:hypothetical protein MPH_10382 [Macrophomina phaseolina MS6]
MLGILEKYAETKWSRFTFWHIYGIPLYRIDEWKDMMANSWQNHFFINLTWEMPTPSKRREGLTSWSWAGWEGTNYVGPYDCLWPLMYPNERHFASVHAEQDDG